MNYYLIGSIVNTHGIKGEVKIKADTDFPRFEPGNEIYILKNNQYLLFKVATHRVHKGFDLVSFVNYQDINLVEQFKGCKLYIDETKQEPLEEDEYHFHELIGKKVYNQNHEFIGVVSEIRDLPHADILEISREEKKNALVPFNKEFIIDVTDEEIIINEIEGLLWKLI